MGMIEVKELKLIGITYNQIESGVYALILEEVEGKRRLPIVVGYPEAQSIECKLMEVKTPRPLSHDVMVDIIKQLGATLTDIYIYRLDNGVYAANLDLVDKDGKHIQIDSRSSDAVAVAIRMGVPIFTSVELLNEAGFLPEAIPEKKKPADDKTSFFNTARELSKGRKYDKYSVEALEQELARLVSEEKYEEASIVKAQIERRKTSGTK